MTIEEMNQIIRDSGMTALELCIKADLSGALIHKILSGRAEPKDARAVQKLENALNAYVAQSDPEYNQKLRETALSYYIDPPGKYTVEDYYALPDERRVELIDGIFYDMAAPSVIHQMILKRLLLQFSACIESQGRKCEVFVAPCDVQLDRDDKTIVQPDLFVICRKYDKKKHAIEGAPDLVVEILSPSYRSRDMLLKLNKYYRARVLEYWIVDPENEKVLVYDFQNNHFFPETYSFDDQIPILLSGGKCHIDFSRIKEDLKE